MRPARRRQRRRRAAKTDDLRGHTLSRMRERACISSASAFARHSREGGNPALHSSRRLIPPSAGCSSQHEVQSTSLIGDDTRKMTSASVIAAVAAAIAIALLGLTFALWRDPYRLVRGEYARQRIALGFKRKAVDIDGEHWVWVERPASRADVPTIVMLHGYTGSKENWYRLAKALGRRHRLVVPDLPGWGESARDAHADYGYAAEATRVAAFLRHIGDAPVTLLGHSMGGGVAAVVAARYPGSCCARRPAECVGRGVRRQRFRPRCARRRQPVRRARCGIAGKLSFDPVPSTRIAAMDPVAGRACADRAAQARRRFRAVRARPHRPRRRTLPARRGSHAHPPAGAAGVGRPGSGDRSERDGPVCGAHAAGAQAAAARQRAHDADGVSGRGGRCGKVADRRRRAPTCRLG